MKKPKFAVERTGPATIDIAAALDYSFSFGGLSGQNRYRLLLGRCLKDIGEEPRRLGSRNIKSDLWLYHSRYSKTKAQTSNDRVKSPRHLILYQISDAENRVLILRVLHDAMDLPKYIESAQG